MPNHVTNVIETSNQEIIKEIITLDKESEKCFDFNTVIPMPEYIFQGDLGQKERELYGKNNWYDWSTENWGTKWNAYSFAETEKGFSFETAWMHPQLIINKLSEKYPEEVFTIFYADEDTGYNCGAYKIKNGQIVEKAESITGRGNALSKEFSYQLRYGGSYIESNLEYLNSLKELMKKPGHSESFMEEVQAEYEEYLEENQDIEYFTNKVREKYPNFDFSDMESYFKIKD